MGLKDRFFTPQTAKAILSWRILLGLAVGAGLFFVGAGIGAAIGGGLATYGVSVFSAMPKGAPSRAHIDPFALGEPWRQIMQAATGSGRKLRATLDSVSDGPIKQRLTEVANQLERGLIEAWEIAKAGNEIDKTVRNLDPTALASKLKVLEQQVESDPSPETAAAHTSVMRQIESADRLKAKSAETAASLRLTQTHLDELVARASEVKVGTVDTSSYAKDVDNLVVRLEALHQAIQETATG